MGYCQRDCGRQEWKSGWENGENVDENLLTSSRDINIFL